jgi:hypothetical protein
VNNPEGKAAGLAADERQRFADRGDFGVVVLVFDVVGLNRRIDDDEDGFDAKDPSPCVRRRAAQPLHW